MVGWDIGEGANIMTDNDKYYLQDSRSYVGNDMLFWARGGNGYTTDLSKAEVYSKDDAVKQHRGRETDIPWPKAYIDVRWRPAVDMQYVNRTEALAGTGIELIKPPMIKRETYNCHQCGRFMSIGTYYSESGCPNCGANNRP